MAPAKDPNDKAASPAAPPSKPANSKDDENSPKKAGTSPSAPDDDDDDEGDNLAPPVVTLRARPRANSKKSEPTLLTDFLRGKQSRARVTAERKRRVSVEAVKAELRHEMKQGAVRRLQQPGGVRERVSAWQKVNSSAMVDGDPNDAASEPTEVAFRHEDLESVTESDRVRIKLRQKRRSAPPGKSNPELAPTGESSTPSTNHERTSTDRTRSSSPPKKRVISDGHWRKGGRGSPPPKVSPPAGKPSLSPAALDKAASKSEGETVSSKIQQWASKVDSPEPSQSPRSNHASKSARNKKEIGDSGSDVTARWISNQKSGSDSCANKDCGNLPEDSGVKALTWKTTTPTKSTAVKKGVEAFNATASHGKPSGKASQSPKHGDSTHKGKAARESTYETRDRYPRTPTKAPKEKRTQQYSDLSKLTDESSCLSSAYLGGSEVASSLANKSIADIPGDIPFGHSAFSELDLPLHGEPKSRPKRPKGDSGGNLKTSMPNVFKKVMEESKKIIHEMNEPPRQTTPNKPPSIEKWLNNTVDPFVDEPSGSSQKSKTRLSSTPQGKEPAPLQDGAEKTPRRRGSHGSHPSQSSTPVAKQTETGDGGTNGKTKASDQQPAASPTPSGKKVNETPPSGGLKRTGATRNSASPLKAGKRPLLGVLKEAFTGESVGYPIRPKTYEAHEPRRFDGREIISEGSDSDFSFKDEGPEDGDPFEVKAAENEPPPPITGPRFRPPTNGDHELSTIMSEEGSSFVESDMHSDATTSTATQSTILTRASDVSKQGVNHAPGLKRRLTKHSDLVSVLSLPDNSDIPDAIKSNRSRPSLRKKRVASGEVSAQELLKEFVDDECMYIRELKTLVDGVVPVLLSHVINGKNATELFGSKSSDRISDGVSKSVVNMGVALEKLHTAHKKAPTADLRKMVNWAHGVVPMYDKYLNAWRLGFEDIVVNLAPALDANDDEDSLLNALPRNDSGDVINARGDRVAVAHLLKRPLIRVKQMTKLMRCVDSIIESQDARDLLRDFENLQDKARRRFREETARMTDEEAINTGTSRCRDLGTLEGAEGVFIAPSRQVSAKDVFSFSMAHANGQRLDCQVELVHRDNQADANDKGDLLIRETGENNSHPHLLFPPVDMVAVSARTGETDFDMVVMVRGTTKGHMWREYFTLAAESEDQVLDWLDILPLVPVPPMHIGSLAAADKKDSQTTPTKNREGSAFAQDEPRSPISKDFASSTPQSRATQVQGHSRDGNPTAGSPAEAMDTTPTKTGRRLSTDQNRGRPLTEDMRPDFSHVQQKPNQKIPHPDAAPPPPPPIHKILNQTTSATGKSAPSLQPPANKKPHGGAQIKRRTSSPLKHEVLPADMSPSEADLSESSEGDSSDDEIESLDIPHTDLGVSIRDSDEEHELLSTFADSQLGVASDCSLTPSNSASQAGLYGQKIDSNDQSTRFMASISRWSDKGAWKDISAQPVCIVVSAGLIEAQTYHMATGGASDKPILSLDLTPLVLIRQSTALDLEIRSSVQPHCKLYHSHNCGNFRFRCSSAPECFNLYMMVHHARLNNQKFIELENQARFKNFGEHRRQESDGDGASSRRKSWFGRKNSYRGSVRAPQSYDGASTTPSSTPSASSFLKRLTGTGNRSFNIAQSSIDRQSRAGQGSGGNSLYTSGSSSAASGTPPRSPSISVENSGRGGPLTMNAENVRIRLHLLVTAAKWEDYGNCILQVRRPPPGWRQALRADHGLEKRITVTTIPRKESESGLVVLDAVLGSGCFSSMGSRGIVCGVWEEVKNGDGVVGMVPATGATGGNIKKWCFQFANAAEAGWVLRLVHQEVLRA